MDSTLKKYIYKYIKPVYKERKQNQVINIKIHTVYRHNYIAERQYYINMETL